MFETFRSFSDYVQEYNLERVEGLLLRHLGSVYKVLRQTVPDGIKTDAVVEMEFYLREMVSQVDSSLLDEWERMRDFGYQAPVLQAIEPSSPAEQQSRDITRDEKAFTAAVRTRIFAFLRAWATHQDEMALSALAADGSATPWTLERLAAARKVFCEEHRDLRLDPEGRNRRHTHVDPSDDGMTWRVEQMLVDREGLNDWVAEFLVDLDASRAADDPVVRLQRLESLVP